MTYLYLGSEQPVPDSLFDTYRMLQCAFPEGLMEKDYIALIANLHDYMSFRALATVLAALTGQEYIWFYNEVSGFRIGDPLYPITPEDIERIRERLILCGYGEWTQNERITSSITVAKNITYQDYVSGYFGKHTEWVNGDVMSMPDPTLKELNIRWFLRLLFSLYLDMTEGGKSFSDPFTMRIGTNLPARQPDNFVILPSRIHLLSDNALEGAANLVVEIITPGCEDIDRKLKFAEYQQGEVDEYWIINAEQQEALFYVRGDDGLFHIRLPENGTYTSFVLPKLKIQVDLLWRDKLPNSTEIIQMVEAMLKVE